MRYELTDLKLFLAIAEARNLSTGASNVHITASSASYRLKNLEQAMGIPLFVRTARGMELTPAGNTLPTHVRELMGGIERMHGDVGRFSAGLKGHVRLLANSSSLNGFIVPSMSRFLVANPSVNIELEERSSQTIPAAIAAQEADIGILAGDVEVPGMRSVRYAVDHLILVAPLDHPLARHPEIRFGEALDFDFVCMNRSSSNFVFLNSMASQTGKALNVRLNVHSFEAVLSLVQQGVGIAMVPRSVAAPALRDARVIGITLLEQWALRELNMIVRSDDKLTPYASAFAQFLLDDPRVAATRDLEKKN